jgi:hypothetical protein
MKTKLLTLLLFITCPCLLLAQEGDQWSDKVYSVEGKWKIQEDSGVLYFELGSDFMTLAGPDLKVYLSPIAIQDIDDRDAIDKKGGVMIAGLKSNKGAQKYPIPEGIQPSDYKSLVIFCPKFSVVWGGVSLETESKVE